jgi:hypothetical protein
MARFGDVLFSGSRFIFWALCPFLVFFIVGMPLLVDDWWPWSSFLVFMLDAIAALFLLALYDVKRFWWAARATTAVVFLLCVLLFVHDVLEGKPWRFGARPGNLVGELLGLLTVGLPCLRYTLLGRFGGAKP